MVLNKNPLDSRGLGTLHPGDRAEIVALHAELAPESYFRRLLEMGFLVGAQIEVMNEAPLSRNPLSIKIKDATYALRREEADCVSVRLLP